MPKEIIKIHRDTIIEQLVNSMWDHIEMNPESLEMTLRLGFRGFENYSDDELKADYREYISEDEDAEIEILLLND